MFRVATAIPASRTATPPWDAFTAAHGTHRSARRAVGLETEARRGRRCQTALYGRASKRGSASGRALPGGGDAYVGAVEAVPEVRYLQGLAESLQRQTSFRAKVDVLEELPEVREFMASASRLMQHMEALGYEQAYALLCLPAIGQRHVLQALPYGDVETQHGLMLLANRLLEVDTFYSSLGGIVGYQAKCLELIDRNQQSSAEAPVDDVKLHIPQGPNLDGSAGRKTAAVEAAKGLAALPHMAEIWPLGGAGDRLGLECHLTGRSVPTAMLPYCGRTLLEGLVRDLQARENLYYRLYGQQITVPVVIMTSDAKDNHSMVLDILKSFNWFGRGSDAFRVVKQPLVPVIAAGSGEWLMPEPLSPMMKPGGHGAIWKLMLDNDVFTWLREKSAQAALVRQISNPLAGTDATMLALMGAGYGDGRTFGFAACERTAGAAEGIDVLLERRLPRQDGRGHEYAYNVTNIEYTEFERLGLHPGDARLDSFPANTNVLYVNLQAAEAAVKAGVASGGGADLPGMVFNGKKTVAWTDVTTGESRQEPAGRMECTMQNLVDSLAQRFSQPIPPEQHGQLNTFVVFDKRRKVTSSAKRKRKPGSNVISQTPDGSFRDLMLNGVEILRRCGFSTPEVGSVEEYLRRGPGCIFLFHPGLGPLWDVIAQKLSGGALAPGSELVLEVAEAAIMDLRLSGSLIVQADCVHGRSGGQAEALGWGEARYQDARSEAEYSPDLSRASGMVVPMPRRRSAQDGGRVASRQAPSGTFNSQCARIRLSGVVVRNRGIDWSCKDNIYWQHQVKRREEVRVILHGQAEFEASNIVLKGSHTFEVPDGYKMVVTAVPGGNVRKTLYPLMARQPSWEWQYYSMQGGNLRLHMLETGAAQPKSLVTAAAASTDTELPFTYMI